MQAPALSILLFLCITIVTIVQASVPKLRAVSTSHCIGTCDEVISTVQSPGPDFYQQVVSGGDDDFYESDNAPQLCKPAGNSAPACSSSSAGNFKWYSLRGEQRPWDDLNEEERQELWDEAVAIGTRLRATMDDYVGRRTSRLRETSSNQDKLFQSEYWQVPPTGSELSTMHAFSTSANKAFAAVGLTGYNLREGFKLVEYACKAQAPGRLGANSIVFVGTNPQKACIVSAWSYAKYDHNAPEKQAYSSTLTWNAWAKEADLAGIKPSVLKYQLRHTVNGQLARGIMKRAHELYPKNVDQVPNDAKGTPLPVTMGHGRWTPDDPAYNALLAIPNIRTSVDMLIDYNDQMDNPYLVMVHTFPTVKTSDSEDLPESVYRNGEILLEYGPMPKPAVPGSAATA